MPDRTRRTRTLAEEATGAAMTIVLSSATVDAGAAGVGATVGACVGEDDGAVDKAVPDGVVEALPTGVGWRASAWPSPTPPGTATSVTARRTHVPRPMDPRWAGGDGAIVRG